MENLISKWKTAQSSIKKESNRPNLNSGSKNRFSFSSSSDSDSPQKSAKDNKNRYLLPVKTEITAQSPEKPLSNRQNLTSPKKDTDRTSGTVRQLVPAGKKSSTEQNLAQKGSARKTAQSETFEGENTYSKGLNQSLKKNRPVTNDENFENKRSPKKNLGSDTEESQGGYVKTAGKKGIPMLIDQAGYKIMDIFKYNTDLSNQEKLQRVKRVLEDVVEGTSTKTDELESQINNLRQEAKRMSLMSRADTSSKIISELEAKLYESEREKIQLKQQKEQLQAKFDNVQNEGELNAINNELLQILRRNQKTLEETNGHLMNDLEIMRRREEEQQIIWQREVQDLTDIMKMLKAQLIQQHPDQ